MNEDDGLQVNKVILGCVAGVCVWWVRTLLSSAMQGQGA